MLLVIFEFDEGVNSKRNEEPFNGEVGGLLNEVIAFTKRGGESDGAHDLVERSDLAGGMGGAKPKSGSHQEQDQLQPFDNTFFGREIWFVGEPGWKKDHERSRKNESGRNEGLFPGLVRWLVHLRLISLMVVELARLSLPHSLIINRAQGEPVGRSTEGRFFAGRRVYEIVEIILSQVALCSLNCSSGKKTDHFI